MTQDQGHKDTIQGDQVAGDKVGGDEIDARGSQGFLYKPSGSVVQNFISIFFRQGTDKKQLLPGARAFAFVVDVFLLAVATTIIPLLPALPALFSTSYSQIFESSEVAQLGLVMLSYAAMLGLPMGYFVIAESSRSRGTLGKRLELRMLLCAFPRFG